MHVEEKIYVGSGKKHSEYDIVNVSLCLSDLPKEHMFDYNGKKYIKLKVAAKREADDYGKTHYVAVDTWKPDQDKKPVYREEPLGEPKKLEDDDLPF